MSAVRAARLGLGPAPTAVAAVALVVALTGCSRLAGTGGGASTPAPPAAVTSSAPVAPDAATLGSISSDLDSAGTANSEADSNASSGDQAAAQDDNG